MRLKNCKHMEGIIGKRPKKGILVGEYTLWTKPEIAVLAYFNRNKNKPTTYRKITNAYVKANYTDYKRACEELTRRGYLDKLENGSFKVNKSSLDLVKRGKESVERDLPYFQRFLTQLKKRKNFK